ncbi:MAG TPA: rhodanese-like domain-containing protein [Anaeromyxobacteraceae bacterium]|nr:rhodanese-like domain-containing protein [Anaeromyxobacteraceae bacterium]
MIRHLASLALLSAAALPASAEDFKLMPMDEVEKRLGQPGFALFDANVPEVWQRYHLPGAVHIVGKRLETLLPADKDTQLVFYCTNPK